MPKKLHHQKKKKRSILKELTLSCFFKCTHQPWTLAPVLCQLLIEGWSFHLFPAPSTPFLAPNPDPLSQQGDKLFLLWTRVASPPQETSRPSVRGAGVSPETPRPVQCSLGSAGRRRGGPGRVQQVPCVWTFPSPQHCLLTILSRFLGQPRQNSPQALESHFLQVKSCTTNEKES